jgi:hypothetical protein
MRKKSIIIFLFIILAILVFFWLKPSSRVSQEPREVVANFYNFWLSYAENEGNSPISERAYQEYPQLTDSLVTQLDTIIDSFEEKGGYDPILCAQDFPLTMHFAEADQTENSATVVVEQDFYGNKRSTIVSLKKIAEEWKIDRIDCPLEEMNYSEEQSKQIVENWIVNQAATYVFDGTDLNLEEVLALDLANCESCYQFVYSFNSRHSGYGNREGKILAQVITPHSLVVTIENGRIVQAVIDDIYDELNQVEFE